MSLDGYIAGPNEPGNPAVTDSTGCTHGTSARMSRRSGRPRSMPRARSVIDTPEATRIRYPIRN